MEIRVKHCPNCNSDRIKQTSSILTRLLLSVYFFMTFLFFTGEVSYGALISLIPFVAPYDNKCLDCNHMFYKFVPRLNKAALFRFSVLDQCVLALAPSMLLITGLIEFFPYTGLGRIVYLPFIYVLNSTVIVIGFLKKTRYVNRAVSVTVAILITLFLSILLYPQEFNPPVMEQLWDLAFGR
ncbi:hypothetical protein P4H65_26290 [Paenibacillus chitinolyticus]|uniref:hypothetical protein n=1 Tax=Paenibacillus chitinolyticus TaxID=79263 RepID=UPI002DBC91D2|nr:hypothetical protein [Paenibacillus chitinolyticus]MEC0249294.1 hypothetical protein [Paenibacillus chitinolyticus]